MIKIYWQTITEITLAAHNKTYTKHNKNLHKYNNIIAHVASAQSAPTVTRGLAQYNIAIWNSS